MRPALIALFASISWAQQVRWSGPASGLVYDPPTHTIRPILGIPGSAHLGPPVLRGVSSAWIAPSGERALVLRDQVFSLADRLDGEAAIESPLPGGVIGAPDCIAWSPDSRGLALYSSSSQLLQRLRWDDGHLSVDPPVTLPVAPSALAVAQDRIYLAEAGTGRVLSFPGLLPVLEQSQPLALAVSPDLQTLYVAEAARLQIVDLRPGGLVSEVALHVAPSSFKSLPAAGVFLLATRSEQQPAVWILDLRPRDPSLYFVPAAEEGN